jgi:hypothetical protein
LRGSKVRVIGFVFLDLLNNNNRAFIPYCCYLTNILLKIIKQNLFYFEPLKLKFTGRLHTPLPADCTRLYRQIAHAFTGRLHTPKENFNKNVETLYYTKLAYPVLHRAPCKTPDNHPQNHEMPACILQAKLPEM